MIVLGIDTSTRTASVAIVDDGRVLSELRGDDSARGADLLVQIDAACTAANIGLSLRCSTATVAPQD